MTDEAWRRERYEVRGVDERRRRYFHLDDARRYSDACLIADLARDMFRHHVVVWDSQEGRCIYDSRLMPTKWPWGASQNEVADPEDPATENP